MAGQLGLLLVVAIVAAIRDHQFLRRGGARSTRKDKILFGTAIGACIAALVFFGLLGASPESLGAAIVDLAIMLFALWEFGRWRARRTRPIGPKQPSLTSTRATNA